MDRLTLITQKYSNYFSQQTAQESFLVNIQHSVNSVYNKPPIEDDPTEFSFKFPERLSIYSNTDGVILTIQLIGYSLIPKDPQNYVFPGAISIKSDVLSSSDNPVLGIITGISADSYTAGGSISFGSGMLPTTLVRIALQVGENQPYPNTGPSELSDVLFRFQITRTLTKPLKF